MAKKYFSALSNTVPLYGLVLIVWFASLANAAHDLWSAWIIYITVIILSTSFIAGRAADDSKIRLPLLLPVSLFLAAAGLSFLNTVDAETSRFEIYNILVAALIFYLAANVVKKGNRDTFFLICGLSIPVFALISLTGGMPAFALNSNIFAGYLICWVPFVIYAVKKYKSSRLRFPVYILALSIIACLLKLRSITATVIVAAGLIYMFRGQLAKIIKKRRLDSWILGSLSLLVLVFIIYMRSRNDPFAAFRIDRLYWWLASLKMFADQPLTGIGPGSYASGYLFYKIGGVQNTLFAHNFFLKTLAEMGIIGISAAVFLAYRFLKDIFKSGRDEADRIFIITLFMIVGFSLTNINLNYFSNTIILVIIAAFFFIDGRQVQERKPGISLSIVLIALLISAIPFFTSPFIASRLYLTGYTYLEEEKIEKAVKSFEDSVSLNPYLSDSYSALSGIYWYRYTENDDPEDKAKAILYMKDALKHRSKDKYLMEILESYEKENIKR